MGENKEDIPVQLLLAEFEYMHESFWRSEEIGEKRVDFFITLATAAIGALVAITEATLSLGGVDAIRIFSTTGPILFASVFIGLFLIGYLTLKRVIRRNSTTDDYKEAMRRIRRYFVKPNNRGARLALFHDPYKERKPREVKKIWSWGRGGLVETVSLMNSLIMVGLFVSISIGVISMNGVLDGTLRILVPILFGIPGGFACWNFQMQSVRKAYQDEWKKIKQKQDEYEQSQKKYEKDEVDTKDRWSQ